MKNVKSALVVFHRWFTIGIVLVGCFYATKGEYERGTFYIALACLNWLAASTEARP